GLLPGGGAPNGAAVEARLHLILRRMCQEESTRSEGGGMEAVRTILRGIGLVVMTVILNSSLLRSQSAIDEVHIQRRAQSVKPDSPGGLAHDPTGIIRKSVQLVLVPV